MNAYDDSTTAVEDRQPEEDEAPVIARRRLSGDDELDITPMIDCVFLLLIFFTVTSTPDLQVALDLAPARYGIGVSERNSVAISIVDADGRGGVGVYLGPDKSGQLLPNSAAEQEAAVREAVRAGFNEGKNQILIKAERGVRYGEVRRVATAAASVEGVKLNLAVMEVD